MDEKTALYTFLVALVAGLPAIIGAWKSYKSEQAATAALKLAVETAALAQKTAAVVDATKVVADKTHEAANSSYSKLLEKFDQQGLEIASLKAQIPISIAEARAAKDAATATAIFNPHEVANGIGHEVKGAIKGVKSDTEAILVEVKDSVADAVQEMKEPVQ